ncbi:unnamed protein product [Parnassius apollo]|uniref:(apollo) hypothetical protein n=1 Tax=Parnassius apollo TaxID=110799 RepID=A0A8S3XM03_PARAO|nr:unnamed protein product [Parnassius apollo]
MPCDQENKPQYSSKSILIPTNGSKETKGQDVANKPQNENSVNKKGRKRKATSGLPFRKVKTKRQPSAREKEVRAHSPLLRNGSCPQRHPRHI